MKRLEQITLKQLRALQMVAQTGTISAAAEQLSLTAPAVHSQLKTLEDVIGVPLIIREGRARNTLTPEGQALAQAEAQIRATLERALREITTRSKGLKGSVVLGAVSTAKYFAPGLVAQLHAEYPDIEVQLKVGNRTETIQGLVRGAFDLCIMGRPPRDPLTESLTLADNPHVLIAAPDHPLAGRETVGEAALCGERFILREQGSGTRLLAERYINSFESRCTPKQFEMDSNETIKQAVMSRLGIALISAHTVHHELETGRLIMLNAPGTPIMRKWYLLTPTEFPPSVAAQVVRDWLAANATALIPDLAV